MEDLIGQMQERSPWLFPSFAFVFGALVGSFLNVVIARVPKGLSIVSPGSRCPRCAKPIAWFDNIPIISWIALRARCRGCGLPISARYPVVELLTGILALSVEKHFGDSGTALGFFAFAAALVALAYIDLDTWLLPHEITWPLLAVGLASPLWNRALPWKESVIGAGLGFALFAAVALFGEKVLKRETMGWGDVWLLAGIGAWFGFRGILPVVLLSSLQGAIVGIALLAVGRDPSKRHSPQPTAHSPPDQLDQLDPDLAWVPPKHAVPFGPFLALAALEWLLLGDALFAAWDSLLQRLFT